MSLNYNTLQALINKRYLPVLFNQIFTKNHYLLAVLKKKAKTYNDRVIVVPLEYAKATTIQFLDRFGTMDLRPEEIVTAAEYDPKMLTGSLTICLEDELVNKSEMAIKNILDTKMKNLQRALQESLASHIWTRGITLSATKNWNTIDLLVNPTTVTVGGIAIADAAWWVPHVIDAAGSGYQDDPSVEADLIDPSKDVYLKKLMQRGIAKAKYQTGENPTMILVPQYIWDLFEFILDPQKTGSKMNEKAASMGFTALDYRNIAIAADDDLVAAQTGDTDGRMYFLNEDFLYMFFNSGARFTASEFVKPANQNAKSTLINAYGNLVTSNRKAQCCITNIRSPKSYAAPA